MKLALVISSLWGGGAERVMSLLANHWQERGETVVLVTFERHASDYPLDARIERVSLDMNENSRGYSSALANNWRRAVALRRMLSGTGASVVVSFEERMNALILLATVGTGLRRIVSERTDPRRHHVSGIWSMLRRVTYPLADALVVQSEAVRPWARRIMLGGKHVAVIPNPVRSMRAFGLRAASPRECTVIGVGRLVEAKGFDVLVRAFAEIVGRHPEWRLVIVGDGPEREPLSQLASTLGVAEKTTFTGWLDEPGEVMARAGVFVLSSRYEGFPNALVEAMASGLPVIATACTGASEIVTHERDGLLVPIDSVTALSEAMHRLIADPHLREALGRRALDAAERYKIETVIREWDAVVARPAATADAALLRNSEK